MSIIDTLYAAISEIVYYRCSLPETFFEHTWFEGLRMHRLLANKSAESDMLLNVLEGACIAFSKGYVKSLAFGISINPDDAMHIREMYAFQFKAKAIGNGQTQPQPNQNYQNINMDVLRRLILLLQEMEPLSMPTFVTSQLTLFLSTPKNYKPPFFLPTTPTRGGYYTILPQFGSAQVGAAATENGTQVQLCVLSVEGSVCEPPLGFAKCSTPVRMDIDNDPQVQVFTATPSLNAHQSQSNYIEENVRSQLVAGAGNQNTCGIVTRSAVAVTKAVTKRCNLKRSVTLQNTSNQQCECRITNADEEHRTCHRCKRKHHIICYALEGDLTQLLAVCITCQASNAAILPPPHLIARLALARRTAFIAYKRKEGHVVKLVKEVGCTNGRGKTVVDLLHTLGFVQLDRSKNPHKYKIDNNTWPTIHNSLFSSSIETALTAIGYK